MPFRGYLTLNGAEIANSSRVVDHLRSIIPTLDAAFWGDPEDQVCALEPVPDNRAIDPGMHNTSFWATVSRSANVAHDLTFGHNKARSLKMTGDGSTNTFGYFGPGSLRHDTAPDEQWVVEVWAYGDPTNTSSATMVVAASLEDSNNANPNYPSFGSASVPPGQWVKVSGTLTVPAGKFKIRPFVSGTTLAAGLVVWVSEPYFYRVGDPVNERYAQIPDGSVELRTGLYAPPEGSRMYGPSMFEVDGTCWEPRNFCGVAECMNLVTYDDTWPGLKEWMADAVDYRVELAPWYSTRIPESGEFAGMWIMDIKGLDVTPVERPITPAVGNGGVAGPHKDLARDVEVDALLIGCTNAGLEYGLEWLATQLRRTTDRIDSVLRFFNAHPSHTAADPMDLLRETHGVVYTGAPEITEKFAPRGKAHQQATIYRVTFKLGVTHPYVYLPQVKTTVEWETITPKRVNWLHQADCDAPYTCLDMPVMFSTDCVPEEISVVASPPPVCGGCMPASMMLQHSWILPSRHHPLRGRETAVSLEIANNSEHPLTLQAFWRVCGSDVRCENSLWPLQVSGLPPSVSLTLDAVSGRYWTNYDGRRWNPVSIVSTPQGAPWRPVVLNRADCWELVVITPDQVDFDITVTMADREP